MADDILIANGTVATDEIGGKHYQKMKLFSGVADSLEPIAGDLEFGLDVDVTRLPELPIGDNLIGMVKLVDASGDAIEWADVGNNAVRVNVVAGSVGGSSEIQYTEGDTDTSIIGNALMMEGAANTLVAATGDATNGLDVDVTRVIPGVTATALGKAEDAVHASGDTGVMALAVRDDNLAAFSGAEGDYEPLHTDSAGALWVDPRGNVAAGSADAGNPIKVGGVYNSSAPTLDSGDRGDLQLDVNSNLKVTLAALLAGEDLTNNVLGIVHKPIAASAYAPLTYAPLTQVTKANIKSTPGNVFSIYITNDNAAVRYFQLHNKASAPAAAEAPLMSFKVPAGSANSPGVLLLGTDFFTQAGKYFSTGIGWAISTTFATFTDSATNTEHIVEVNYV